MMTGRDSPGQGSAACVTRFAPSPTGRLHLGHALSAIRAHDLARAGGGVFLLRIEDIDASRSRTEHVETILRDLEWLGLTWDGPVVFQSDRLALYGAALDDLRSRGLTYPCFCTRAEIAASTSAPHGTGAAYPGTCRGIDAAKRMDEPHCWRLDMAAALAASTDGPGAALAWRDALTGSVIATPGDHGDIVLARKDAPSSYHLSVTVDDAAQGVTDIVRGADLFAATHVQRLLQELLGLPTPRYHHHPLLLGSDGTRLAKRHGAPTLAAMRESGVDGPALAGELRAGRLPNGVRSA